MSEQGGLSVPFRDGVIYFFVIHIDSSALYMLFCHHDMYLKISTIFRSFYTPYQRLGTKPPQRCGSVGLLLQTCA